MSTKCLIMGILNVTPDSFSDGGKYFKLDDAIKHIEELIKSGVDIIDIGGESTRPGAMPVTEEEELKRVIPVIKWCGDFHISIDTYKSNVAKAAIKAGASIINDVSGLTKDLYMVKVAAHAGCKIVIMHNDGIPANKPSIDECRGTPVACPDNVIQKIYTWLQAQTNYAIQNGIKQENIIIDPGIGFGKTAEEDLFIIENLKEFKSLGFPILIGPSKKSFIKKLFGDKDLKEKSKEIINLAIKNGAGIVRVHI